MIPFNYKGKYCKYDINEIAYFNGDVFYDVCEKVYLARIAIDTIKAKYQKGNVDIWLFVKKFQIKKEAQEWVNSVCDNLKEMRRLSLNGCEEFIVDLLSLEDSDLIIVELDSFGDIINYQGQQGA